MSFSSIGDMANSFLMRGHNTRIKSELMRLSDTLASGKHSDMSTQLRGEFTDLAAIERSIRTLKAHRTTARETSTLLETAQISLGTIQDLASNAAPALISASNSYHAALLQSSSSDAEQKFNSIVSALNVQIADRAVFSGVATDRAALPDGTVLLNAVRAELVGATTRSDIEGRLATWFTDPSGGFATTQYRGSNEPLAPIPVSDTEKVNFKVTALAPEIRQMLQSFAMAALVTELPALADPAEGAAMMKSAGELMLSAQTGMSVLRAEIGALEEYTDTAKVRNGAALSGFEIARGSMYQADPYQAATELELAQTQLEAVYTLTARLSRLSLSDYLK
jgi:flagellar hook-associated protein 3 FlgL